MSLMRAAVSSECHLILRAAGVASGEQYPVGDILPNAGIGLRVHGSCVGNITAKDERFEEKERIIDHR